MNIGALDRKIAIQQAQTMQDAAGEEVETWWNYAVVYARKIRKSAGESVTAEQSISTKTETYQTRYKAGVTEKMRIVENGQIYSIRAVSEIGRKAGLEITAEYNG